MPGNTSGNSWTGLKLAPDIHWSICSRPTNNSGRFRCAVLGSWLFISTIAIRPPGLT